LIKTNATLIFFLALKNQLKVQNAALNFGTASHLQQEKFKYSVRNVGFKQSLETYLDDLTTTPQDKIASLMTLKFQRFYIHPKN